MPSSSPESLKRPAVGEPACLESVADFHDTFCCPVLTKPQIPDAKRCKLRVNLIQEELNELKEAIATNDLVEVADALADIQYVLSGTVHEFGLGPRFKVPYNHIHVSMKLTSYYHAGAI
jgi:predicted HAD superfamily Cof-like phosphohydrolase